MRPPLASPFATSIGPCNNPDAAPSAPQIVVSVSLVRPTRLSHYGGVLAGPVFKRVMSFALQQMRIPPSGSTAPKMKLTW